MHGKQLKILVITLLGTATFCAASERPNILFIMSDDHAAHAIGTYGGRLAQLNPTPTLDQLASEGMVLDNVYCNNSICTPSRASIMTGQYSYENGVTTLNVKLATDRHYLSKEMQQAGYQTAVIGKWHLKATPQNFDYFKVLPGQGSYINPTFEVPGSNGVETVTMEGHSSDCITDSAIEWLDNRDPNKPFFLKYHFKAPHAKFIPAERYDSYLADVEIPEPANLYDAGNHGSIATRGHNDELRPYIGTSVSDRHEGSNYADNWGWGGDASLPRDERTSNAYQTYLRKYLRCVKGVDDNIQRMIDYLKAEGLYDNTVIIYTADQGFYLGEHDFIDKRWGYEEGMRMPFIIRYPDTITAGTRSDAIIENVDFAPTMLDFAGVATPNYMRGKSFRSILETGVEPADWKQAAYYHYWFHMVHHYNPAHFAIRTKQYKLMMFYGARNTSVPDTPPGWELYDLQADPFEMNNLYDDPAYSGIVTNLKAQLRDLRAMTGDDDPSLEINTIIDEYWDYDAEDRARAIQISAESAVRWKEKLDPDAPTLPPTSEVVNLHCDTDGIQKWVLPENISAGSYSTAGADPSVALGATADPEADLGAAFLLPTNSLPDGVHEWVFAPSSGNRSVPDLATAIASNRFVDITVTFSSDTKKVSGIGLNGIRRKQRSVGAFGVFASTGSTYTNAAVAGDQLATLGGYDAAGDGTNPSVYHYFISFEPIDIDDGAETDITFRFYGYRAGGPITGAGGTQQEPFWAEALSFDLEIDLAAHNDSYTLPFGETSLVVAAPGVLSNDTSAASATLVSDVSNGTLLFSTNGAFTYTADAGFEGTDTFVYSAVNGTVTSTPAIVTLTVALTDSVPSSDDDAYGIDLRTHSSLLVSSTNGVLANDTYNGINELFALLDTDVSHGSLALNADGSFTYTPVNGFTGEDSFTYQAYTIGATGTPATVSLSITKSAGTKPVEHLDDMDLHCDTDDVHKWVIPASVTKATYSITGADSSVAVGAEATPEADLGTQWKLPSGSLPDGVHEWTFAPPSGNRSVPDLATAIASNRFVDITVTFSSEVTGLSGIGMNGIRRKQRSVGAFGVFASTGSSFTGTPAAGSQLATLGGYDSAGDGTAPAVLNYQSNIAPIDLDNGAQSDVTFRFYGYRAAGPNVGSGSTQQEPFWAEGLSFDLVSEIPYFTTNSNLSAITGLESILPDTLIMTVTLQDGADPSDYYPMSVDNLASNDWKNVAHSDAADGAYAVSNLTIAGGNSTNKVIYLKSTNTVEFFRIDIVE